MMASVCDFNINCNLQLQNAIGNKSKWNRGERREWGGGDIDEAHHEPRAKRSTRCFGALLLYIY